MALKYATTVSSFLHTLFIFFTLLSMCFTVINLLNQLKINKVVRSAEKTVDPDYYFYEAHITAPFSK